MSHGTATATRPEERAQKTPLHGVDDEVVVAELRKRFPDAPPRHADVIAVVNEMRPEGSGQKGCGASRGYRILRLLTAEGSGPEVPAEQQKVPEGGGRKVPTAKPEGQKVPGRKPEPSGQKVPAPVAQKVAQKVPASAAEVPARRVSKPRRRWPVVILGCGAFVAVWTGWVGLGEMTGFGKIEPLPGLVDWTVNTAITLPLCMEVYAAFALDIALSGEGRRRTRRFAGLSSIAALVLGGGGQMAYHLLQVAHVTKAPWPVVIGVSWIPVLCLGAAATLLHMINADRRAEASEKGTD